jgi:hypothetical protein
MILISIRETSARPMRFECHFRRFFPVGTGQRRSFALAGMNRFW